MAIGSKTVRVPVKWVNGQWELLYGGGIPVKEGALAELRLDQSAIEDKQFLAAVSRKAKVKILDEGVELRVALTIRESLGEEKERVLLDRGATKQKEASKIVRSANDLGQKLAGNVKKSARPAAKLFRDFLVEYFDGPSAPFDPGTIVLTTNIRGAYMRFMQIDLIARNTQNKREFMIELPKTRYPQPFEITPSIKAAIVRLILREGCDEYAIPVDALQAELLSV